jgi:3-methyladenine DNA glycosylase AlkD
MLTVKKLEAIILQKLLDCAGLKEVETDLRWQNYINTKHITLGIKTTLQRNIAKEGFATFNELALEKQLELLTELFQMSDIFEIKNQCLLFLDYRKKRVLKSEHWSLLKEWVKHVDNWAHSDGLSSVFTVLMQNHLALLYPQLQQWNKSKNPWERRQSLVCLFYYSRTRKSFHSFEDSILLISNLLDDKEYYVQKGLGWALREASNVYYEYTYDFIQQHIKDLKPAAYSAAIENLLPQHKEIVKVMRKKKSTF